MSYSHLLKRVEGMKKLLNLGMLITSSNYAKCDKTITCVLVVGLNTEIQTHEYTLRGCRASAINSIGYDGYYKVRMKFWDERNGKCIEETFKR